jgi:DNA-directed RNA polymerase delta subunit
MKTYAAAFLGLFLASATAWAVRDWHDLDEVHKHIQEAIHEMDRARAANHYDMDGHGAKAERLLHDAERELDLAVASARGR